MQNVAVDMAVILTTLLGVEIGTITHPPLPRKMVLTWDKSSELA